jgi:hypothetical protein
MKIFRGPFLCKVDPNSLDMHTRKAYTKHRPIDETKHQTEREKTL